MVKQSRPDEAETACKMCHVTALRKASRRLTQFYDEILVSSGLRSTQLAILAELDHREARAPTLAELARALVMDRSSLGHNLRPLERDGLLSLEEGEDDRRQRRIMLTPQGKAKLQVAQRLWSVAQQKVDAIIGAAEAAHLRAALLAIANEERLGRLEGEAR